MNKIVEEYIFIINIHGDIIFTNNFLLKKFDYKKNELKNKNIDLIFKKFDLKKHLNVFKKKKIYWNGNVKAHDKNGNVHNLFLVLINIKAVGAESNYMGIMHDPNTINYKDNISLNEKEIFSNLNSCFAFFSHELKTPLNSILGFTTLLLENEDDFEKLKKLKVIKESAGYILDLVNNILDFSKISLGKLEINNINFLFVNTVKHIYNLFLVQANEKNIDFSVSIDESVPNIVYGDELRITQIFINLLSNAFKFTNENGYVKINCSYNNNKMCIEITDNGIGISKSGIKKIFNPFESLIGIGTNKEKNTGLGLAIIKILIQLMKGKIKVKSVLGEGTRFIVKIPLETGKINNEIKDDSNFNQSDKYELGKEIVDTWLSKYKDVTYKNVIINGILKLPENIKELEKAILKEKLDDIQYISHKLKGYTGSYGMSEIYEIIFQINKLSKESYIDNFRIKENFEKLNNLISLIPYEYVSNLKKNNIENVNKKNNLKIIITDDSQENLEIMKAFFNSISLDCETVNNGRDTLDKLNSDKYDILLIDLRMPEVDGMSTVSSIRKNKKLKKLYVIGMSADNINKEEMINNGFNDCLMKPIKFNRLKSVINDFIKNKN